MNKTEFLNELRKHLWKLPIDELEAALTYYEEFIEDAGPEKEAETIAKLGTPVQVAENIFREFNTNLVTVETNNGNKETDYTESPYGNSNYSANYQNTNGNTYHNNNGSQTEYRENNYSYQDNARYTNSNKPKKSTTNTVVWIIILVLASPLILGFGGSLIGIIIGILGVIFGLAVAAIASVAALIIAGIGLIIGGISAMFVSTWGGLLLIGTGLVSLGFGLLLAIPSMLLFTRVLPQFIKWIIKSCKRLVSKVNFQTI